MPVIDGKSFIWLTHLSPGKLFWTAMALLPLLPRHQILPESHRRKTLENEEKSASNKRMPLESESSFQEWKSHFLDDLKGKTSKYIIG